MRRRRALLLFGVILALLLGYLGWCWRTYYLPPPVQWDAAIAEVERPVLKRWIRENARDFEITPRWSWSGAWYLLRIPYDRTRSRLLVIAKDDGCYVRVDTVDWVHYVELRKREGRWVGRQLTWEQSAYVESQWETGALTRPRPDREPGATF